MKRSREIILNLFFPFNLYKSLNVGLLLSLTLSLTACFEPAEDCLDIDALNYNIEADQPCSDCCTFPDISVAMQHRFNTATEDLRMLPVASVFTPTIHEDDFGNFFRFKDLKYFISNVQLVEADGTALGVQDSLSITVQEVGGITTLNVEDNFALIETANLATNVLGNLRGSGDFIALRFNTGLISPANEALFSALPTDHPLREEEMYISDTEGFILLDLELYRDSLEVPLDSVQVQLDRDSAFPTINLPINFSLNPGFNVDIVILADYAALLSGVNVKDDDAETIRQKIVNNLENVFSVTQITSNN